MSPTRHYVDPPDTAYVRERYKRVAIEASHRDDSSLIQIATKNLSRRVESIIPARPFLDQPLNKVESLVNASARSSSIPGPGSSCESSCFPLTLLRRRFRSTPQLAPREMPAVPLPSHPEHVCRESQIPGWPESESGRFLQLTRRECRAARESEPPRRVSPGIQPPPGVPFHKRVSGGKSHACLQSPASAGQYSARSGAAAG
jgi:hypothetical protein